MSRIGIDIGGTFTDLVLVKDGEVTTLKVPSTPDDPSEGALEAMATVAVDPTTINEFDHGTTIATNIIIERNPGARVVFLTNDGFADIPEIMRTDRENQYDRHWKKPDPLVPRTDRHGIPGRITVDGAEHRPLDESSARDLIESYAARDEPISYAISMLHSFVNPAHERQLTTIIDEIHPDADTSASHAVFPQAKEYERASTVIANAYVKPQMSRYVDRLRTELADRGIDAPINIMQSNGGLLPVDDVVDVPAKTLFSGPAAGIAGANHFGSSVADNIISLDMGGTSTDVGIIRDGTPLSTTEGVIEWGLPVQFPQMDIETVGAGGGSIAWIDPGGLLKVGPQSAGADPGPACYGQGGNDPTITDANLVLGRLNPESFLGGDMALDSSAAHTTVADLGAELDMEPVETALGILEVGMNTLTQAIRSVTVERGADPRDFSLVAFGGAGPMHAPGVIRIADIPRVIVPPNPGVLSAAGLLTTDYKYDQLQSFIHPIDEITDRTLAELNDAIETMANRGKDVVRANAADPAIEVSADLRYTEQAYEVNVPLNGPPVAEADVTAAETSFHARHEQLYGHANESDAVEMVNIHVDIIGRRAAATDLTDGNDTDPPAPVADAIKQTREIVFANATHDTTVYDRDKLSPGHTVDGPAIVEEPQSTTVVFPAQAARVDPHTNLIIEAEDQ